MTAPSRKETLDQLASTHWDVLVIGGGINGAGVLRDLARRSLASPTPLRVALLERGHFSGGTSGRNSQLIHGGLRYLKNFEFRLVSEALRERATLLRIAPHLVRPLAFLIPLRSVFAEAFYRAGLTLYDGLAGNNRIERHRALSSGDLHELEPKLAPFHSALRFWDCGVHSARLVLLNLREAASFGAPCANYVSVQSFGKGSDGVWHLELTDTLSETRIQTAARALVNATGAWSQEGDLRLVRGSHLILPRLGNSENAISYFGRDGRIIFFIPWGTGHNFTLIGTTDADHHTGPDRVRISSDEVRYLLNVADEVFPGARNLEPISAYSSLRPLLRDTSASATKTSREHRIWADADGVVHIAGGKYTTFRAMCEETCDLLLRENFPELRVRGTTSSEPILGNTPARIAALLADATSLSLQRGIEDFQTREVIADYGVDTPDVLGMLSAVPPPEGLSRLEAAQIRFAAQAEWVQRLSDLMFVSTYWGYERRWTADLLEPYARELGTRLGWNSDHMQREVTDMLEQCDQPRTVPEAENAEAK